mgnify:CR=1 FL=1
MINNEAMDLAYEETVVALMNVLIVFTTPPIVCASNK